MNPYAQVLDKDTFTTKLKKEGIDETTIESEWQRIETVFACFYLKNCFQKLPEKVRESIAEGVDFKTLASFELFYDRLGKYLSENIDAIDQRTAIETSLEETVKAFILSKNNNG